MPLQKVVYVPNVTKIGAKNLNEIQDEIIRLAGIVDAGGGGGAAGGSASNITVDNVQAGINSKNVQEAIKELKDITNTKANSADLANYVLNSNTTATGGAGQAGKVVKLDGQGKLDTNMIPDLAITSVKATDKNTAQTEAQNGVIQVGDVVILTDDANKVYMCKGNTGTFENDFIELHIGEGTVKKVNGKTPNAQGEVTVESKDISYGNATSNLTADKVQDAIDEIVTKFNNYYLKTDFTNAGGAGNADKPVKLNGNGLIAESMLEISLNATATELGVQVNSNTKSTVPVITDGELDTIINTLS